MEEFSLDPRLAADTVPIMDLKISTLLLMNEKNYPWFIIVPKQPGAKELFDLDDFSQKLLLQEISLIAEHLKRYFKADKVNIAALGNQVEQLHVHIIMRYKTDIAWPKPVWDYAEKKPYNAEEIAEFRADITELLGKKLGI